MSTVNLPPQFVTRMRRLLGEEANSFLHAVESPPCAGLRVNTGKIGIQEFVDSVSWDLQPIPWSKAGFRIANEERPGRNPMHAAGLYYLQEPSAMSVAEVLDVQSGDLVLDLAAAPGGKATHIASLLAGSGALVANEIIGSRIKPLGENLERWGASNTILLNEEPGRLADRLGPVFDRLLLDAPCSGEGMFRKSPIAIREWSPEHVAGSAARQAKILLDAARLVRPGGHMVYSTCTFAPEENELQIARFLDQQPEWKLVPIPQRSGFSRGRPEWSQSSHPLERAVRIWPHLADGEGHFLALLQRSERPTSDRSVTASSSPSKVDRRTAAVASQGTIALWRRFVDETLAERALHAWFAEDLRLVEQSGTLYLVPDRTPGFDGLRVVRPGLPLGEAKPGRFEPSHALALALGADESQRSIELTVEEAECYLFGEQVMATGSPGWLLVTIGGFPLGWGKRSGNVVKNHYPKGLRRMVR